MANSGLKLLGGVSALFIGKAIYDQLTRVSLKDKVILITGGSRGLGLVMARQLAASGAKVSICARDKGELNKAISQLRKKGTEVSAHLCDVSDRAQVETMVQEISSEWGKIDVLINNAGIIQVGPVDLMRAEEYEEALKINLWGGINTTLAVLPQMKKRKSGNIVNITSIGGKVSIPHLLPYSVSKFALVGFSEGLHAELKKYGIKVTTVCPGLMRTGSHENISVLGQQQKEYGWFSLTGTNPLVSVNAERAASTIIKGFRKGKAEIIISFPAQVLALMHGIFPGFTAEVSGLVNYLLPDSVGEKGDQKKGYESHSSYAPSFLTKLGEKAAEKNNELNFK